MGEHEYMRIIDIDDSEYPQKLKELEKNIPKRLYCLGKTNLLNKLCCAVVGSRKASGYGKWTAYNSGKKLAENGIVTVSGMAYGCDAAAHEGALDAGGDTIAVLGCGLDICYPSQNRQLRERIIKNGLLVSEYPLGTKPLSYHFPNRNRIISGLSKMVIVAEASLSSGSLITAEFALEQNRDVAVFPGNITNIGCMGGNKLIQEGAYMIVSFNDLLENLGISEISDIQNSVTTEEERSVIELLRKEGALSLDQIASLMSENIATVNSLVSIMEIKGMLRSFMGKIFIEK